MAKKALVTGITGQDGSYLAEFLLQKGYEVWGIIRRSSSFHTARIDHLYQDPHDPKARLRLVYGDLCDGTCISSIINEIKPDEFYNLGAQSHVRVSFDQPVYTVDSVAVGPLRVLEAIRQSGLPIKFYQASSSEMFGAANPPQNENTPFYPRSPYACAKLYAYWQTINYREGYNMFACNGILFNHESPRRGETFVTRKITRAATRIKMGLQDKLFLGNLDAKRDWGFAGDYVQAMWLMLQQDKPDDYVVATGEAFSVREFLEETFSYLNMDWKIFVEQDAKYLRPTEVNFLLGDATKAHEKLGWKPVVSFKELVHMMVESDLALAQQEVVLKQRGLLK